MRVFYFVILMGSQFLLLAGGCREQMVTTPSKSFYLSAEEKKALLEKAQQGDPEASFRLADYYLVIENDHDEAMKWLENAAEAGHLIAQSNLGYLLSIAPDTKDHQRAVYWFARAAESGDQKAKVRLAEAYEIGKGVQKDLGKARLWYEKAALDGDTVAIMNIAEYNSEGKGGRRGIVQAYVWLMIAASKIHPESVYGRIISAKKEKLLNQLSPSDLERANKEFDRLSEKVK